MAQPLFNTFSALHQLLLCSEAQRSSFWPRALLACLAGAWNNISSSIARKIKAVGLGFETLGCRSHLHCLELHLKWEKAHIVGSS